MPSNSSGHFPLTHYERTKKFKSSNYGTTTTRLSGDTQVAFGHCSLSLAPIMDDTDNSSGKASNSKEDGDDERTISTIAMVTPSGHLYSKQAIYEYLLTKTADYKEQLAAYEQQTQQAAAAADTTESTKRQRQEAFDQANSVARKKTKSQTATHETGVGKQSALNRTSYWLPDMQPDRVDAHIAKPDRPASPYSGQALRRKDLRELELQRKPNSQDVLCRISGKAIRLQPTMAYWTKKDKSQPGVVVLKDVYDRAIATTTKGGKKSSFLCPLTNQKIKHTMLLQSGGSGFAAHNAVQVKTYKPTIT